MESHRLVSGEVVRSRCACFVSNCNTVSHHIEICIWNRPNVIFSATFFKNWIKNKNSLVNRWKAIHSEFC